MDSSGFDFSLHPLYEILYGIIGSAFGVTYVRQLFGDGPFALASFAACAPVLLYLCLASIQRFGYERRSGVVDLVAAGPADVPAYLFSLGAADLIVLAAYLAVTGLFLAVERRGVESRGRVDSRGVPARPAVLRGLAPGAGAPRRVPFSTTSLRGSAVSGDCRGSCVRGNCLVCRCRWNAGQPGNCRFVGTALALSLLLSSMWREWLPGPDKLCSSSSRCSRRPFSVELFLPAPTRRPDQGAPGEPEKSAVPWRFLRRAPAWARWSSPKSLGRCAPKAGTGRLFGRDLRRSGPSVDICDRALGHDLPPVRSGQLRFGVEDACLLLAAYQGMEDRQRYAG